MSAPSPRTCTPDAIGTLPCPGSEFVVGHGLDPQPFQGERYRNLRDVGTLAPHVYS